MELADVDGGAELTPFDTLSQAGKAALDAAGWHFGPEARRSDRRSGLSD
jgi:hypothetical protein